MTIRFNELKKPLLLAVLLFICVNSDVFAQRTANRQYHVDINTTASILATPSLGGSIMGGQYLLSSRWEAGLELLVKRNKTLYYPTYISASYLFRLCSNSTRSINLYAGLGGLLGAEITTPEPPAADTGYGNAGGSGVDINFDEVYEAEQATSELAFIYGFQPKIEAEVFILRRMALVASIKAPLTFGSAHQILNVTGNIGLRFNL